MAQTGMITPGRPTLGAWSAYGLGTIIQNLPAYIALLDPAGPSVDGVRNGSSGWLPPVYQGTAFRSEGTPVLNLNPKVEKAQPIENAKLDLLRAFHPKYQQRHPKELELDAPITNLELAARMQLAATDAMDITRESVGMHSLYGLNNQVTASYGKRCLMARWLVKRGVRFVQIMMRGQPWDTHTTMLLIRIVAVRKRTSPSGRCSLICSNGGCSIRRSYSGEESLAVHRGRNCVGIMLKQAQKGVIITPTVLVCGWPAVGSREAKPMARQMNSVIARWLIAPKCRTIMLRFFTYSVWIMKNLCTPAMAVMKN